MTMKFVIDKQFLLHEGGTKFYQVMRVKRQHDIAGLGGVTVKNWGPQKGSHNLAPMKDHGRRTWFAGDHYSTWIGEKKKRGYKDRISWGWTNVLDGEEKLEEKLVAELGRVDATAVLKALGIGLVDTVDPTTDAEHSPAFSAARSARAEHVPVESESLEEWGEF